MVMPWYRVRIRRVSVVEVALLAPDEETARQMAREPLRDVPEEPVGYESFLDVEVEEIADRPTGEAPGFRRQ
jgi:hypothetical protein